MKLIKKLNPFNPILPAFCLLIAFAWVGYDSFFREKYTEEEKAVFVEGIKEIKDLSVMYYHLGSRINSNIRNKDYYYTYCLRDVSVELDSSKNKLERLNKEIIYQIFDKNKLQKEQEILITSAFENYIDKAIKMDSSLKERYQDFTLEDNLSNKELNQLYFSDDTLQNQYHLQRFKTQLAKLYYEDVNFLYQEKVLNPVIAKMSNYSLKPHIFWDSEYPNSFSVAITYHVPFDTTITKLHSPEGLETKFDKRGFLIIPSELRNKKDRNMKIKINLSQQDTVYHEIY
ncbi:hypothetical protein WAF17_18655 [Bernardetia sp. ABR2-2B]|uniref:hypothetical protein n=1 Tax=Bernardetia sp. ABR2-2B TaxID=3127472 RepID=UPI0030D066D8